MRQESFLRPSTRHVFGTRSCWRRPPELHNVFRAIQPHHTDTHAHTNFVWVVTCLQLALWPPGVEMINKVIIHYLLSRARTHTHTYTHILAHTRTHASARICTLHSTRNNHDSLFKPITNDNSRNGISLAAGIFLNKPMRHSTKRLFSFFFFYLTQYKRVDLKIIHK